MCRILFHGTVTVDDMINNDISAMFFFFPSSGMKIMVAIHTDCTNQAFFTYDIFFSSLVVARGMARD